MTLKIKTPAFEVKVRSRTLPHFVNSQADLFEVGKKVTGLADTLGLIPQLLEQEYPISARLMGLRLSSLSTAEFEPTSNATITKVTRCRSHP